MTIRNLDALLRPRSVVLVGASGRPGSVGAAVLRNALAAGDAAQLWLVNPRYATLAGRPCLARIADLPGVPDLGVVMTPPDTVPDHIARLGARGCRTVVVMTPDLSPEQRRAMLDAARPYHLRIIGPNSAGLVLPNAGGFNASFMHAAPAPGRLALVSQSGSIASAVVDWADGRGIGFSQVISLGEMADVDVADCLDLLAGDGHTRAVLLYLESIPNARRFLSAARATSRLKPVIAIKAGRSQAGATAAATHTGTLSGADEVAEAALRRAGVLRVRGLSEVFSAAETVSRYRPAERARLGIVTNGGGAGVLAVDRLADAGGELAVLGGATLERLGPGQPGRTGGHNPVDIGGDAPPERYVAAIDAMAADPGVDVILAMNCPTALADPVAAARAVAARASRGMIGSKPLLSCWLGGAVAREARAILHEAGVASYDTPAEAAGAVGHLTAWGRAQAALLRIPDRGADAAIGDVSEGGRATVAAILAAVAAEGRRLLTEPEAMKVVAAYGIPVPEIRTAATPAEAGRVAGAMLATHPRLVVKLLSREIPHKSDVGGVVLDVETAEEARNAAEGIAARVASLRPGARFDGFTLQPMVRRPGALELILGLSRDPAFGPVILFGAGGTAVEVLDDTAIGLPPLDAGLADDLVRATRVGRLLAGYRERVAADLGAIRAALVALSHLIEDFPCLRGLDVNPLLADADGVVALDAGVEIDPTDTRARPNPDLAIRPYPAAWRRELKLRDGKVYEIRPIQPADALLYEAFLAKTDPDDIRMRFLAPRRNFPVEMALRLTQLDYDREMAFVAIAPDGSLAGVSRLACDPDYLGAEYALIVRSDMQGLGLGSTLMGQIIAYAKASGLKELTGLVLAANPGMQSLVRRLGFVIEAVPDEPSVVMSRLTL